MRPGLLTGRWSTARTAQRRPPLRLSTAPLAYPRSRAAFLLAGVGALDAVDAASVQVIGSALNALVGHDKRMLDVAHSVGLPTAAPGLYDVT
jgi:hypothetical protein